MSGDPVLHAAHSDWLAVLLLVLALYAAFKLAGALLKAALWIAILLLAWWYFGPALGIPWPW